MNIIKRRQKIIEDLKDKEYRDAFAIEIIDTGVPFQIHALREQRGWTQKDLGKRTKMAQETISRVEDPNYGKLTLKTLKRLASTFDVALLVRFVSFSELVEWELHLTPESLETSSFEEDPYFNENPEKEFTEELLMKQPVIHLDHSNVIITDFPISEAYNSGQKRIGTPGTPAHNQSLGAKL